MGDGLDVGVRHVQQREHQAAADHQHLGADAVDEDADERRHDAGQQQGDQVAELERPARPAELGQQRFVEGGQSGHGEPVGHQEDQQGHESHEPGEAVFHSRSSFSAWFAECAVIDPPGRRGLWHLQTAGALTRIGLHAQLCPDKVCHIQAGGRKP